MAAARRVGSPAGCRLLWPAAWPWRCRDGSACRRSCRGCCRKRSARRCCSRPRHTRRSTAGARCTGSTRRWTSRSTSWAVAARCGSASPPACSLCTPSASARSTARRASSTSVTSSWPSTTRRRVRAASAASTGTSMPRCSPWRASTTPTHIAAPTPTPQPTRTRARAHTPTPPPHTHQPTPQRKSTPQRQA